MSSVIEQARAISEPQTRLAGLDELRGLAAFLVLVMHLIQAIGSGSGVIGSGGVSGFFLLTGFLMPYLLVEKYQVYKNASLIFLVKRIIRLSPPYLAAAFIVAAYQVFRGHISAAEQLSGEMIFCHLTYSCGYLQLRWYGEIFWTLAIEFQYYLFSAMVMAALGYIRKSKRIIAISVVAVLMIAFQIVIRTSSFDFETIKDWMPSYSVKFVIGLVCYGLYRKVNPKLLWPVLAGLIYFEWSNLVHGITISIFALCLIIQTNNRFRFFKWLGKTSYSMYLTHGLFGVIASKAVMIKFDFIGVEIAAIICGILVSLIVAQLFWAVVEKPAQRWSDSVRGEKLPTAYSNSKSNS